jgi:hypothetical protein
MSVTQEQRDKSASETMKHVQHVRRFILRFVEQIMVRSSEHDASKLEEPELSLFAEWGPKLTTTKTTDIIQSITNMASTT